MDRTKFWETMNILVEKDFNKNVNDDIEAWVENVVSKRKAHSSQEDDESVIAWRRRLSECESSTVEEEIRKFSEKLTLPKIDCKYVPLHYRKFCK
ncbi:hypothetical protein JTB14_011088 [Gonioctena quinquepunctata]|nr:hypothetical protein JTB14_011088 [Gonioctena quinquepunctata]